MTLSWLFFFFSKFWIIFVNSSMIYSISSPFCYLEYLHHTPVPFIFQLFSCEANTVLNLLCHPIVLTTLESRYYCNPSFTDEGTETWRSQVICSRSQNHQSGGQEFSFMCLSAKSELWTADVFRMPQGKLLHEDLSECFISHGAWPLLLHQLHSDFYLQCYLVGDTQFILFTLF